MRELDRDPLAALIEAHDVRAASGQDNDGRFSVQWERLISWAEETGQSERGAPHPELPANLRRYLLRHPAVQADLALLLGPKAKPRSAGREQEQASTRSDRNRKGRWSVHARVATALATAALVLVAILVLNPGADEPSSLHAELVAWMGRNDADDLASPAAVDALLTNPREAGAEILLPRGLVIRQPGVVRFRRGDRPRDPLGVRVNWLRPDRTLGAPIVETTSRGTQVPWPPQARWPVDEAAYFLSLRSPGGETLATATCRVAGRAARKRHRARLEQLEANQNSSLAPWLALHYALANDLWAEAERLLPRLERAGQDPVLAQRLVHLRRRVGR